nr:hypothetical protein [Micromonospora sp. DSM 115978]
MAPGSSLAAASASDRSGGLAGFETCDVETCDVETCGVEACDAGGRACGGVATRAAGSTAESPAPELGCEVPRPERSASARA